MAESKQLAPPAGLPHPAKIFQLMVRLKFLSHTVDDTSFTLSAGFDEVAFVVSVIRKYQKDISACPTDLQWINARATGVIDLGLSEVSGLSSRAPSLHGTSRFMTEEEFREATQLLHPSQGHFRFGEVDGSKYWRGVRDGVLRILAPPAVSRAE